MKNLQISMLVLAVFALGFVTAWNLDGRERAVRRLISSGSPWEELAAYSRAVVVGDSIFISGTVGRDPDSGEIPKGAKAQTEVIFHIFEATLGDAEASLADLVRLRICLVDAADIEPVAEVLRSKLSDVRPANITLVCELMVPEARVEIEATAVRRH